MGRWVMTVFNNYQWDLNYSNPFESGDHVLVVGNFDASPQSLTLGDLGNRGNFEFSRLRDLYSGEEPSMFKDQLVIPPFHFYWLTYKD